MKMKSQYLLQYFSCRKKIFRQDHMIFCKKKYSYIQLKLVLTAREGKADEDKKAHPLHDVHHHPAEADLQRAEVRVDGEDLHDLEVAGDHPRPEQPLRDDVGIVGVPLLARQVRVDAGGGLERDHVAGGEAEDDPGDEADVCEPVRQVPEVRHVLGHALLVHQLDVPPQQTHLPTDRRVIMVI